MNYLEQRSVKRAKEQAITCDNSYNAQLTKYGAYSLAELEIILQDRDLPVKGSHADLCERLLVDDRLHPEYMAGITNMADYKRTPLHISRRLKEYMRVTRCNEIERRLEDGRRASTSKIKVEALKSMFEKSLGSLLGKAQLEHAAKVFEELVKVEMSKQAHELAMNVEGKQKSRMKEDALRDKQFEELVTVVMPVCTHGNFPSMLWVYMLTIYRKLVMGKMQRRVASGNGRMCQELLHGNNANTSRALLKELRRRSCLGAKERLLCSALRYERPEV